MTRFPLRHICTCTRRSVVSPYIYVVYVEEHLLLTRFLPRRSDPNVFELVDGKFTEASLARLAEAAQSDGQNAIEIQHGGLYPWRRGRSFAREENIS